MKETIYTYFYVEFQNCTAGDGDFIVVPEIDEIIDLLRQAECDLDDPEFEEGRQPQVIIKGIGLTNRQFADYLEGKGLPK